MRYLSVCSGIEAASVAWHQLGWTPVGFSEIEPFPAAVLKHRFPNVPNYGDMTKHKEWPLEPGSVDLFVGGTPCQSFSVAGLRKGLHDPRGGLMLTYLEIARRLRPQWVVWENVPGVLSSNGGRDFGSFLGALGELGYGWAYRVLDAQWVRTHRHPRAVPQRRRRVFVVGCLGDWERAAAVLFERESVQRDSAPRRAQGEGAASDAEGGVARCVTTGEGKRQDYETCTIIPQPVPIQDGREMHKAQNGIGIGQQGDPAYTLDTTGAQTVGQPAINVAVVATVDMQACKGNANVGDGSVSPTLCKPSGNDVHAVVVGTDCYNGAITGDVAATMGTPGSSVNASGPTVMVAAAFPINTLTLGGRPDAVNDKRMTMGVGENGDPQFTLQAAHGHAVAHAFYSTGGTHGLNQQPEVSPAVKVGSGLGIPSPPAVVCINMGGDKGKASNQTSGAAYTISTGDPHAVAHALRGEGFDASEDGTGRGTPLVPVETLQQQGYNGDHASTQEANAIATLRVLRDEIGEEAFAAWGLGVLDSLQPSQVLRARLHGEGIRCASFSRSWPIDCAISRPEDRAAWAVQSVREAEGEGCSPSRRELPQQLAEQLGAYLSQLPCPGPQAERLMHHLWCAGEGIGILRQALSTIQEVRRSLDVPRTTPANTMTVRRLTATECEFLQGFPRNWTLIPWRKKPAADCPDGPRYKALGNSMAVNCMAWIGERIHAYEQTGRVAPAAAEAELMERSGSGTNEGGA